MAMRLHKERSPIFAAAVTERPHPTAIASIAGRLPGGRRPIAANNSSLAVRTLGIFSLPTRCEIHALMVASL